MNKNETVKNKPQFNKSLGSGVKSMFGGKGRKYFVLEHRTHSTLHKAGDVQEIIVDYIELGRDTKCQVRFGDDMMTVSRRHAAIFTEDDKWVVKNLSATNQTIINGRPVSDKWYLQNGDELQLSAEGPKIGFVVPQINTVASLGFSKRLSLFRQQALRPYKTAIVIISIIFLLAVAALAYGIYQANKQTEKVVAELNEFKEISKNEADSLKLANLKNEEMRTQLAEQVTKLESTVSYLKKQQTLNAANANQNAPNKFSDLYNGVYQIIIEDMTLSFDGQTQTESINVPVGSGFLLSDKRFITARHVIEPWYFIEDGNSDFFAINVLIQVGAELTVNYLAVSPSGQMFRFTNNSFKINRNNDKNVSFTDENGDVFVIQKAELDSKDWAVLNTSISGGLAYDTNLSNTLSVKTNLDVLGYPLGMTAQSGSGISPIYGSCVVSADGLQNGVIMISDRNFEHGNSGGPVFVEKNGKFYVVGIISAGAGDGIGFVVPISAVQ